MNNGEIRGNTAGAHSETLSGGGVFISRSIFTMNGGKIMDNTCFATYTDSGYTCYGGGGVSGDGTFTMNDGIISGNKSNANSKSSSAPGVGVAIWLVSQGGSAGVFTKLGGTIYGSNAPADLANTVTGGSSETRGDAVSGNGPGRIRKTTAGPNDKMYGTIPGTAGGWGY